MGTKRSGRPAVALLVAALACAIACALAVAGRLGQRELGVVLEGDSAANTVRVTSREGAFPPSTLLGIAAGDRRLEIRPTDVIEEPDFFDTYPEMADFFGRQTELTSILAADEVTLTVKRGDAAPESVRVRPKRPTLRSLPGVFWFQIFAGAAAALISVWALALRARDLGVRIFAVMGTSIPIFTLPAAVYSTRELALDGGIFRALSSLNHAGANLFGIGLVALFVAYPVALVRTRWLWLIPGIVIPWLLLDITRLAPNQNWGSRAPIMLETFAALVFGVLQWRATRGDPRGRPRILWLGVSIFVGTGLFVFSVVGSTMLGWFPPIAQGYSFGFFLLMHASFAFGLGRHRVFDLDRWAYTLLFWVLGGLAFVVLDVILITVLDANRALSTGGILIACGFIYLPLRSWLFSRTVSRRTTSEHDVFDAVLQVTFATSDDERTRLWKALLTKVFDPMELRTVDEEVASPAVREDGIGLDVPSVAGIPSQRAMYPWRGRGLFGPPHEHLAANLVSLVRHAGSRREAFERGARDERTRIAQDMHDDVGSGLLSSLHRDDLAETRDAIRQALGDVRSIVQELTRREVPFSDLIAEMRLEVMSRLEAAKIAVDWPPTNERLDTIAAAGVYRHLTSMLRELTSNVIRHSGANSVRCRVEREGDTLVITFADDGKGIDAAQARRSGLENLRRRAAALGGEFMIERVEHETVARVRAALRPVDANSRL